MPALPLIDALILAGSGGLAIGFVLKVIWITTSYRPMFLGFSPMDILIMSATLFVLALTLAARTWVKYREAKAFRHRHPADEFDYGLGATSPPPAPPSEPVAPAEASPAVSRGRESTATG